MASGFFVLSRFFLRVDGVLVRLNESRLHHQVSSVYRCALCVCVGGGGIGVGVCACVCVFCQWPAVISDCVCMCVCGCGYMQ